MRQESFPIRPGELECRRGESGRWMTWFKAEVRYVSFQAPHGSSCRFAHPCCRLDILGKSALEMSKERKTWTDSWWKGECFSVPSLPSRAHLLCPPSHPPSALILPLLSSGHSRLTLPGSWACGYFAHLFLQTFQVPTFLSPQFPPDLVEACGFELWCHSQSMWNWRQTDSHSFL